MSVWPARGSRSVSPRPTKKSRPKFSCSVLGEHGKLFVASLIVFFLGKFTSLALTGNDTFQCRSINDQRARHSRSEIDRRTGRGGDHAARGVSSWSSFCCVRLLLGSRSLNAAWCEEEAPDSSSCVSCFVFRSRVASPRAASIFSSIADPIYALSSVVQPRPGRRSSTSAISRLAPPGSSWRVPCGVVQ